MCVPVSLYVCVLVYVYMAAVTGIWLPVMSELITCITGFFPPHFIAFLQELKYYCFLLQEFSHIASST